MSRISLAVFIVLLALATGCGNKEQLREISVANAMVRPAKKGQMTAGYFTVRNHLTAADVIVGATCDCARVVELHRMMHEGMTMKMEPVSEVALPAGTEVRFEPHGLHLMLLDVKEDLSAGAKVKLVLKFRNHEPRTVEAKVGEP